MPVISKTPKPAQAPSESVWKDSKTYTDIK